MKKNFNIAIIGAGYMAEEYLKVFSNKKIECRGIYSRTLSKAKRLKKKYNIQKLYLSLDDLKNDNKIKAIIILVNEESTKNLINKLDVNKYKILCEKPVGINIDETKKITSKINSRHFYVALNRRLYGSNIKAKKLIKNIKGSRLISIRDQEMQNAKSNIRNKNWMYLNSVHLIDYINFYARGKIVKINRIKKFKNYQFSDHLVILYFSSKDQVIYYCNWNSPGTWSVNIIQKNHSIEMKPLENLVQEKLIKGKRVRIFHNKSNFDTLFKPGLFNQVTEFLKMLKGKNHNLVNLKEYYKTVKIINKIYA